MSQDTVRCTSCGRSFQNRAIGPKTRCMYCGGKLAGPGLEHLELVEPTGKSPGEADPSEAEAPRVKVLEGHGPSRWDKPVLWLHELVVLAMLLMLTGLTMGLVVRNDPMLPPSALRTGMLALLPVLWLGGLCLRAGLGMFTSPARSVLLAMPLLLPGLLLGLPSGFARFLARLEGRIFGLWGLAVTLVAFVGGMSWLDAEHDPLSGVQAWLEAQPVGERVDPDWAPVPSGWSGRLIGRSEGAFTLNIDSVSDGLW